MKLFALLCVIGELVRALAFSFASCIYTYTLPLCENAGFPSVSFYISLFVLLGLAAASGSGGYSELTWEPNQEYDFKYQGRLLTGIPELASQYTGLGIQCSVRLQVQEPNKFAMKIEHAQFSKVNDVLRSGSSSSGSSSSSSSVGGGSSDEENNWRNLELPSYQPMPEESARFLSMPTIFEINESGAVKEVTLSKEEPEWSVNFKKALIVLFQTKTREGSSLESNTVRKKKKNTKSET